MSSNLPSKTVTPQQCFETCSDYSCVRMGTCMGEPARAARESRGITPKDDILARLHELGNRKSTSWEAAAICVAAHAEITQLRATFRTQAETITRLLEDQGLIVETDPDEVMP